VFNLLMDPMEKMDPQDHPPRQGADTLSMKKAIGETMRKMESPHGSSN
jgi:arylsulfatase